MAYKPEEVLDLRSRALDSQGPSHDAFEASFMQFAEESEKRANEAKSTPKSETQTKGSIESNIDNEVADTNHTNPTAEETNGMQHKDGLGNNEYRWGEPPPEGKAETSSRRGDTESLSTSAEEGNNQDNLDLLARSFNQFAEARHNAQEVIKENLDHGKPGTYVTRSKTLLEKVRGTAGRS